MYSSLHEKIAKLVAKKKYAVTSCWAKKVYLPTFKFTLATSIIKNYRGEVDPLVLEKIKALPTYHHAYVKKVEKRELTADELSYMAKFYLGLKVFIQEKKIELIIVHNDTRWYHAIAILLCKELDIKYLVTEQGLIRPYTTVIDNQGVNANANMELIVKGLELKEKLNFTPKYTHDSVLSMFFFFVFIGIFTLERTIKSASLLRYMHNNYRLDKYKQRFLNRVIKKNEVKERREVDNKSALLLLQLEHDSQFLMYSDYQNNQEVINRTQKKCSQLGLTLAIKKHPLDQSSYKLDNYSYLVGGDVILLARQAKLVIAVNSSAILSVLKTTTPLFIIGESIYEYKNMAEYTCIENIILPTRQSYEARCDYIYKIKENYLLKGAGYSFNGTLLSHKLISLLDGNR